MKFWKTPVGNRTHDLPACSAVPQQTAPPRVPAFLIFMCYIESLIVVSARTQLRVDMKGCIVNASASVLLMFCVQ